MRKIEIKVFGELAENIKSGQLFIAEGGSVEGRKVVTLLPYSEDGKETHTDNIDFKNVDIKMTFNNAHGKAKRSGATTILEVYPR